MLKKQQNLEMNFADKSAEKYWWTRWKMKNYAATPLIWYSINSHPFVISSVEVSRVLSKSILLVFLSWLGNTFDSAKPKLSHNIWRTHFTFVYLIKDKIKSLIGETSQPVEAGSSRLTDYSITLVLDNWKYQLSCALSIHRYFIN